MENTPPPQCYNETKKPSAYRVERSRKIEGQAKVIRVLIASSLEKTVPPFKMSCKVHADQSGQFDRAFIHPLTTETRLPWDIALETLLSWTT